MVIMVTTQHYLLQVGFVCQPHGTCERFSWSVLAATLVGSGGSGGCTQQ